MRNLLISLLKKVICLIFTKLELLLRVKPPMVTILAYHSISPGNSIVDVSPKNFASQIKFLKSKFNFITLKQAIDFFQGKLVLDKPSITITFDDGYADLIKTAVSILKKYYIPATVFVLAQPSEVNRKEVANKKALLTFRQIKKLQQFGWTIGCHGATHANLGSNSTDYRKEVLEAKKTLGKKLKAKIDYFAYPKGIYNKEVIDLIKLSGYKAALTTDPGIISTKTDLYRIPRVGIDRSHTISEFPSLLTKWATAYFIVKSYLRKIYNRGYL